MKKKKKSAPVKKTIPKPTSAGTKVTGAVNVQYVQYGVSDSMIIGTVEALAQVLTSEYYRQFCGDSSSDF